MSQFVQVDPEQEDAATTELAAENFIKALRSAAGDFYPADPPKLEDSPYIHSALVSLNDQLFTDADSRMWDHRRQWALNCEFALDRQGSRWDRGRRSINRNPKTRFPHMPRLQLNLFKPIFVTAVSRFLSTSPTLTVWPGSADQTTIDAARVADRVVGKYEWERQRMDSILATSLPILLLKGTVIWKTFWKYDSGAKVASLPRLEDDKAQSLVDALTGKSAALAPNRSSFPEGVSTPENTEFEELREGNVETVVVDPNDFLVDPAARDEVEEADWVQHVSEMTPARLFRETGVRVTPDGQGSDRSHGFFHDETQDARQKAVVLVKETHFKKGPVAFGPGENDVIEFESNYAVVTAGGKVVSHGPVEGDEFPFTVIRAIRVPGQFWGDTIFNSLRGPQSSLNKTVSQIAHANDLMGNPQWLLPDQANVPQADMTSRPGTWIRYTALGSVKPEPVQPPTVAIGVFRHLDYLMTVLQEISGQYTGGMKGGAPGRVDSGVAFEALAERDTTRLHATAAEVGRGIESWGRKTLQLIKRHWILPRTITVSGRYMESETVAFHGKDVAESFDVRVVPESVIPQSKAAKFQKAFTLYQGGLLPAREALRRMGEEEGEELTLEQLQVNRARDENRSAIETGQVPVHMETMALEDSVLHIEEHLKAFFDPAVKPGSPAWMALYVHILWHNDILNGQMGPPAPPPPGGPEEGGGAPPPDPGAPQGQPPA